jgi:hypothetical protein
MLSKAKIERAVVDARNAVVDVVAGHDGPLKTCAQVVHDWRGLDLDEQVGRNLARLDERVIPWKRLVKNPAELGGRSKKPLIFMHVPKAGGTTLEYLIAKNYVINGVLHINAPALERNPAALFKKNEFPHVAMGHHKLSHPIYQFAEKPFVHITILREPVGRILSYYNYLQTSEGHGKHEAAARMSLREFIESRDMVEVHNAMTMRYAGKLKRRVIRKNPNDPAALESAKETLEKRFSFFGLTERYTEFLLLARRLLGWNDIFYQRRNVSRKHTKKDEVEPGVLDTIRERNANDIALYDFARALFDDRCRELGIGEAHVAEFDRRNEQYAAITGEGL